MPSAEGGVIADGTYHLHAITRYGVDRRTGPTTTTLQIAAGVMTIHTNDSTFDVEAAGPITTSGNRMTITFECPREGKGEAEAHWYTATGTTLTFYDYDKKEVTVFERQ